jgi:L-malate glycosyltransferase
MKVLLVNHTSTIGGGEHSLLQLLAALPEGVDAVLACPEGPLMDAARRSGFAVERLPQTDGSLKLHPWHTARGVASLVQAAARIRRLARRHGADVVHANSIRAGLSANLAARAGAPPAVVHVRDCLPEGRVSSAIASSVRRRSGAIVGNSRYTLERFGGLDRGVVVHNPVDPARFDPGAKDKQAARASLGLPSSGAVLGVVAQLTPWKGQDDAVRMLARLREAGTDADLLLAGSAKFTAAATRHDNRSYVQGLHGLVARSGLQNHVHFLGECDDVPAILAALDLLLLPSWEEPFGRAIIEAFAMGIPVVATDVGGTREIVTEGQNGLLRPPRDPGGWAEAVASLLERPDAMGRMGRNASQTARRRFTPEQHAAAIVSVYERVVRGKRSARAAEQVHELRPAE